MGKYSKPNYAEIAEFLTALDIDPTRVPENGITEEGFRYWPDNSEARMGSDGKVIGTVFRKWPEKDTFEKLSILLGGGTLK